MSHDPHHIIEVLPVHLRLALPEEWCSMINALKLGESAAAAHMLDGIEVADDGYDQLFASDSTVWDPRLTWARLRARRQ